MSSIIILALLVVAAFIVLCYFFNESKIEFDSPTIAAMEARAEAQAMKRRAEARLAHEPLPESGRTGAALRDGGETPAAPAEPPPMAISNYEYREMLKEGGENYVLPQWMVNFFSSSDICHTLDRADNVVLVAKLNDASNAQSGVVDVSADCDMSTQTIALNLCLGEGAASETLRTKFYLFERGDLFELDRLVRQNDVRIDVLTRAADYTLEYVCTVRAELSPVVLSQLRDILSKVSI